MRFRIMGMHNKSKLIREFNTWDIVVAMNQTRSRKKDGVDHKLLFKTKSPYILLEKDK